ncbi:c-type cytochrome [Falsigemmobacter faecalis]|nr:cytochrome c [Falsigemmobacter faecalis]
MKWTLSVGLGAAGLAVLAACAPLPQNNRAESDFATYCAGCHGADGAGIAGVKATNLTTLSSKNGGTFPRLQVMGKIYGYTMGRSASDMPEFGQLLEGESVPFDAGDGTITPTPKRLVELTRYLESIQQ